MKFSIRNLSVLSYAQGFTLWHYKGASGQLSDIAADGFFNAAGEMLAPGDMMMISAGDGGRILCVADAGKHVRTAPLG